MPFHARAWAHLDGHVPLALRRARLLLGLALRLRARERLSLRLLLRRHRRGGFADSGVAFAHPLGRLPLEQRDTHGGLLRTPLQLQHLRLRRRPPRGLRRLRLRRRRLRLHARRLRTRRDVAQLGLAHAQRHLRPLSREHRRRRLRLHAHLLLGILDRDAPRGVRLL